MKKQLLKFLLLTFIIVNLLTSCGRTFFLIGSQVKNNADLSDYHTYQFQEHTIDSLPDYVTMEDIQLLEQSIAQQMEQRGYSFSKEGELLVNLGIHIEEKESLRNRQVSLYDYPGHGYYNRFYWGGYYPPTYANYNEITVERYDEAKLVMHLMDVKNGKVVFESKIAGIFTSEAPNRNARKKRADNAVSVLFQNYPLPAKGKP